jgi:hypothetical protein
VGEVSSGLGQGQEQRLPEESRALGIGGERDAVEIVGRRLDAVNPCEVAVRVAFGSGEDPGEITVVPHQTGDEAARFLRHREGVRRELREGAAFLGGGEYAVEA